MNERMDLPTQFGNQTNPDQQHSQGFLALRPTLTDSLPLSPVEFVIRSSQPYVSGAFWKFSDQLTAWELWIVLYPSSSFSVHLLSDLSQGELRKNLAGS